MQGPGQIGLKITREFKGLDPDRLQIFSDACIEIFFAIIRYKNFSSIIC